MIKNTLLCVLVILSTLFINTNAAGARQPKFFFVSSTTSTTISLTTLPSSVTMTCLQLQKVSYAACAETRKKKSLIRNEIIEVTPSKSNRRSKYNYVEPSHVSTVEEPQRGREARFAWYYMTTTLTTISTSTTYSLTTVKTVSVTLPAAAPACTPSSFIACG